MSEEMPLRSFVLPEEVYASLDPGIRFAVRVLNAAGIETCQSCQGGDSHSYDQPSVDMHNTPHEPVGFAALTALRAFGLPVTSISCVWNVQDGLPYESVWRVEFKHTMEDRADEKPNFVWSYQAVSA